MRPDWDYTGATEDAKWMMIAGQIVADAEEPPAWKEASEFRRTELAK